MNNPIEFLKRPIGTGPFKFKEKVPGDHVLFEANPDYFMGRPYLDFVLAKVIPDRNTRVAQLKAGDLDLADLTTTLVRAFEGDPKFEIQYTLQTTYNFLHLKNELDLFSDKRVRQAMVYGLDRKSMLQTVLDGKGVLATGPISPATKWYNNNIKPYEYSPEKAQQLLEEAGWRRGADGILAKGARKFGFTITVDQGSQVREQEAAIEQQAFKKLGMDVKIELTDFNTAMKRWRAMPTELEAFALWYTHLPHPDVGAYYVCGSTLNNYQYCNPEVDKIIEQLRSTGDENKQRELSYKFQEIVAADQPLIFLYYPMEARVLAKYVKGYPTKMQHDGWALVDCHRIWLEK
jgi:peptide/nickel transport system substrate-binding protein